MARPRKDAPGPTVEQRLEAAFWELIVEKPVDCMTVGDLTARAGCNRGTFYYYYDDMYAMLDAMIDRNLPKELPPFFLMHFSGGVEEEAADAGLLRMLEECQPMIDRLCLLLANASPALVSRRIKGAIMEAWARAFAIDDQVGLTGDARIMLEFVVSGMLGLMAYRAETGMRVSVQDIVGALAPELPEALVPKLGNLLRDEGVSRSCSPTAASRSR